MAESPEQHTSDTSGTVSPTSEDVSISALNTEIMAQIQQLVQHDKMDILLKVVDLYVQKINQTQQLSEEQECIKHLLEERVLIKKNLIVQHDFKTNAKNMERQKQTAMERLQEQLEVITAQKKSNDSMRSQLKVVTGNVREDLEAVEKRMSEIMNDKKLIQRALDMHKHRMKQMNQELNIANVENINLQKENHANASEVETTVARYEEMVDKIQNDLSAKEAILRQRTEELQRENQKADEQLNASEKLRSEKDALRDRYDSLQQTMGNELLQKKQQIATKEKELKKSYEAMITIEEQNIRMMQKSVEDSSTAKKRAEERILQLEETKQQREQELQRKVDHNKELAIQLEKLTRSQTVAVNPPSETVKPNGDWSSFYAIGMPMTRRTFSRPRAAAAATAVPVPKKQTHIVDINIDHSYVQDESM